MARDISKGKGPATKFEKPVKPTTQAAKVTKGGGGKAKPAPIVAFGQGVLKGPVLRKK